MGTRSISRTTAKLKKDGWTYAIVEHWNSFAKVRVDLWSFADILAIKVSEPHLLIQACDSSSKVEHLNKILANDKAKLWLETGGSIELWKWRQLKLRNADGKKLKRDVWVVDISIIKIEQFYRLLNAVELIERRNTAMKGLIGK